MRVVAGSRRGRRLTAPPGEGTRPTSDRVREAVHNALDARGLLVGARVLDLFAGSGAMGIEALSRGASTCTFVDQAGPAVGAIHANLAATDLADRGIVVRASVESYLRRLDAADAPVDVAFVDPPYAFDDWDALLRVLPATVAVLESDRELVLPAPWRADRCKRYGGTVVQIAAKELPADLPTGEA
ncbi:MAG: 16S rRNA (guanine(966)-N(2))-methyltransferase RsmD [Acidimicrobiales bacterium]|nr:16S rRNA (guanine(966)-N(2))-methyltransferase RsmD [Acidimicrobiales bacterium]